MSLGALQENSLLYVTYESLNDGRQTMIGVAQNALMVIPYLQGLPGFNENISPAETTYIQQLLDYYTAIIANAPISPDIQNKQEKQDAN